MFYVRAYAEIYIEISSDENIGSSTTIEGNFESGPGLREYIEPAERIKLDGLMMKTKCYSVLTSFWHSSIGSQIDCSRNAQDERVVLF